MTNPEPRAGRREWIGLAVLMLPLLLVSMDTTVLLYAVPAVSAELEPTSSQLLWILDIYGFVLAGLLITMGTLGDRIGRRRLLLIGAGAFGLASAVSAYSSSAELLIATRALLGVGGATLMPSTAALVRNMFHDPNQRRTALGVWMAVFTGGVAAGPLVGGLLLDHFWWGSVFLINVPVMLLLVAVGPALLPEYRDPNPGRFDPLSVALSLGATLPTIYGIKQAAEHGLGIGPALTIAAGLVVGALFVLRQRRPGAMIDVGLFRERGFGAAVLVNVLAVFVMIGYALFTVQYLQVVLGYSPIEAALWSLPTTFVVGAAAPLTAALARTVRPAYLISGGMAFAAGGLFLLTRLTVDSSLLFLLTGATMMSAGVVSAMTLTGDMILTTAPPERAGAASALSETASELGGALGFALLGSLGAAVYRNEIAAALPAGLPDDARAVAGETIGGAVEVAAHLPGALGAGVVRAAQVAFTEGFAVTALAGSALLLVTALLAAILLRDVARPAGPDADVQPDPTPEPAVAA